MIKCLKILSRVTLKGRRQHLERVLRDLEADPNATDEDTKFIRRQIRKLKVQEIYYT